MRGISMETILGVLVGLAMAGVLVAVLFRAKVLDMTFDERQERARGVAYKWGFLTMAVCLALYGVSDLLLGRWCDGLAGAVLCFCVAGTVFASVCIRKGAYMGLRESRRTVLPFLISATALNLLVGIQQMAGGGVVVQGILTYRATNLLLGITCLVILLVYLATPASAPEEDEE